ncbi:helix-turn-helix transcriptional regulator [uncultured Coprobacter sp.]|uniref:helix-turn-helix domain-containing protein n=1 Tax=uncultured Coprobacter sp. TaxID=1720550 RepID=UPI002618C174|nr:helix-turn-helix transcriptional regulator [uncultured Coprobacter sp.]
MQDKQSLIFREELLAYRKESGCSQLELSKKIGVNVKTIIGIEKQRKQELRLKTISKIERFFEREKATKKNFD